jgi:hypothetical protein
MNSSPEASVAALAQIEGLEKFQNIAITDLRRQARFSPAVIQRQN